MSNVYVKDPADVLDYKFDWTGWLATSEVISTSTMTLDAGLTMDSASNNADTATVWLSGGTSGQKYRVANKIVTNQNRTVERSIVIVVEER